MLPGPTSADVAFGHRPGGRDGFTASRVLRWTATAVPDRKFYAATGLRSPRAPFPVHCPARRFVLTGTQAWIGWRGDTLRPRPEIDLGGWSGDPGVSRLHALLQAGPDGWTLLEPGSLGGTAVNDVYTPVPVDVLIPVGHGTRIHVGVWTTITLRAETVDVG
ncbi:FHA domain-containing protein [Dactylosporangium cerinum]|uniref:FHA domain-containing protein n=1 Tax=Dactylosporangium cerinum TaxID=1434730 RepID=A0ABV9WD64_9ACTN